MRHIRKAKKKWFNPKGLPSNDAVHVNPCAAAKELRQNTFKPGARINTLFALFKKRSQVPVGEIRRVCSEASSEGSGYNLQLLLHDNILVGAPGGKNYRLGNVGLVLCDLVRAEQGK